jgi:hypothetical protein
MRDEARAHYDRGLALYQAKDYAAAIRELEAGFATDPRREFLFAEAQAKRLSGDCRGAVPLYQRFLDTAPPPVQASAAQIALGRCAQMLAAARAEPQAALPPPPLPPPPPPPPRWSRDPLGIGTLAAGAALVGTGVGFLVASLADESGAPTLAAYRDEHDRHGTYRTVAFVALGAGAALAAASAYRYTWLRRRARLSVTVALGPGGLVLGGAF